MKDETRLEEEQREHASWEPEIRRINSVLSLYAGENAELLLQHILGYAKELEKIVTRVKAIVQTSYQHDGDFFVSVDGKFQVRMPDGLHFLKSLSDDSFGQAFTYNQGERGIEAYVEKVGGDVNNAIVELQSLERDGKFYQLVPRKGD